MQCPYCSYTDVRPWERDCPSCGKHCGYPNLRRANEPGEVLALEQRFAAQEDRATTRDCAQLFAEFVASAGGSQAVMSRIDKVALSLLENENSLWRSFYDQVSSGLRRPEETPIEDQRSLADERLFPKYRNEICFAALSLNGLGPAYYGTCSVTFTEELIAHRASVFEENGLSFVRKLGFGPVPSGSRAPWNRRGQLAGAKLGGKITPGLTSSDFEGLLMSQDPEDRDPEFIEVHVYGALHRSAISRIRFWPIKHRADGPIRKQILAVSKRRNITV
jgi:hypothetical protein